MSYELEITDQGNILYSEPKETLEWHLEPYKGWAIEYPIITEPDGTKYTPLDADHWRTSDDWGQNGSGML